MSYSSFRRFLSSNRTIFSELFGWVGMGQVGMVVDVVLGLVFSVKY